ncbi:MAG: S41 family peptidase [Minisyncoccia bacterium]
MGNNFFKYRTYVLISLLVLGGVFFSGYYFGKSNSSDQDKVFTLINKTATTTGEVDFSPFWKAWNVIDDKYVPSSTTAKEISSQTRVYGAIEGMVKSLGDPYTIFFPPVESKSFSEEIKGQIEGVGMEVDIREGVLTVIAPVKDTPAYRAGIKSGDKIFKIGSKSTENLNTQEAIALIRGPKGTSVTLTIFRKDIKEPFELSMIRDVINIPTVDTETKGDVFIIHLYSFSSISPNLFRNALREFVESGKYKMIIDLRGNPGGYLEAAQDMASWFLPTGKVVVSEDFRDKSKNEIFRSKGYNIFNDKLKLVVLIDGGSASASEILAGALHDHGVATLVGVQSFGKGSVQELIDITYDTSLKVTVAKWLTPNGISISHQGLTPDIIVKLDEEKFKKDRTDTQMLKALEILSK